MTIAGTKLTDENLDEFLDYLGEYGLPAGPGERVRAHRLLATSGRGRTLEQWKYALCPVFARDAVEQSTFYRAFDMQFQPHEAGKAREAVPADAPRLNLPPGAVGLRRRKPWRMVILAAILCVLAAGTWYVFNGRTAAISSIETANTLTQQILQQLISNERIETRTEKDRRPCKGLECLTANWWGPVVAALPVVLWMLYALVLAGLVRTGWLWIQETRAVGPFRWPFAPGGAAPARDRRFFTAARLLRKRMIGDLNRLDILKTISAIVRSGGFPEIHFQPAQTTPEYVGLISREGPQDHLARYAAARLRQFRNEGVPVQTFFFDGDPRLCRREGETRAVPVERIAAATSGARLMVIADAESFLDPITGKAAAWTVVFSAHWHQRALLVPKPRSMFGQKEAQAAPLFLTLPLRFSEVDELLEDIESPVRRPNRPAETAAYPPPPMELLAGEEDGAEELLAMFFHPKVFRWLCACAVHRELDWEWTLELAGLVDGSGSLLRDEEMLSLVRLQWFREGKIPPHWRKRLIGALPPELLRQVRTALLDRLQQERERPPKGTFAYYRWQLDVASQTYWLNANPPARAAVEAAMANLPQSEVDADPMLAGLRKSIAAPSSGQGHFSTWVAGRVRGAGRGPALAGLTALAAVLLVLLRTQVPYERTQILKIDMPSTTAALPVQPDPIDVEPPAPGIDIGPPSTGKQPLRPFAPPAATAAAPGTLAPLAEPPVYTAQALQPGGVPSVLDTPLPRPGAIESRNSTITQVPPARVAACQSAAVTKMAAGRISITALTSAGDALPNRTDITLSAREGRPLPQDFKIKNVAFNECLASTVMLDNVPDGKYRLSLDPAGAAGQKSDIAVSTVSAKADTTLVQNITVRFDVTIDPKTVVAIDTPSFRTLNPALQRLLDASANVLNFQGKTGAGLYDALDDSRKAGLLNIAAKAERTKLFDGSSVLAHFTELSELRGDRFFVRVDPKLYENVRGSSGKGTFADTSGTLDAPPPGFQRAGAFRTRDTYGSMQLKFYSGDGGSFIVDADIDLNSGLRKTVDAIKNFLGGPTHPYTVGQVLRAAQKVDPGYRLITSDTAMQELKAGGGNRIPQQRQQEQPKQSKKKLDSRKDVEKK